LIIEAAEVNLRPAGIAVTFALKTVDEFMSEFVWKK